MKCLLISFKVHSSVWKIFRSKKRIALLAAYAIFSVMLISFLKSRIYPESEDCHSHNETKFNFDSTIDCKIEAYLKHNFPNLLSNNSNTSYDKSNSWVKISETMFVYSAYIDRCPSSINLSPSSCVIFIGMTLNNDTETNIVSSSINCALKSKSNVIKVGFAFVEKLPEHHSKPYTAAFYYCDLTSFLEDLSWPDHASLYEDSLSIWVPVRYLKPHASTSDLIVSLCVRPMYGFFSSLFLTEFLAYYSIMGVEHFIFYNQNMSESLYTFLKFVESSSLSIEVLPWNFPLDTDLIHEYGQIVFTQDCIARSKYKFTHTIIVDLDEYIVPKLHASITDLVWYLDNKYKHAGSYSIPMVLFCDEFSLETKSSFFHAFTYNKRQKTYWDHGIRSKYIAKPDRVQYGGVHFVWKYVKSWYEVEVSNTVALLHHYRHCCGLQQTWFFNLFTSNVLNDDVVFDNSLINLSDQIINHSLVVFVLNVTNSIAFSTNYC